MKTQYLIILLLFSLSACGFHLRGSGQNTTIKAITVYVTNQNANLIAREVKQQLTGGGAKAVVSAEGAKYMVKLENEYFDQTVLSVSPDTGKVEEYQISMSVNLTVIDATGKERIIGEEIRLIREYTFDEDAVLGKYEEEQVLRDELVAQAASEIIRRLNAEEETR